LSVTKVSGWGFGEGPGTLWVSSPSPSLFPQIVVTLI
jgi:hypothetical protein